jgi:hypothetical protein
MPRLALIVDPHAHFANYLTSAARSAEMRVTVADNFVEARSHLADPDLAVLVTSLKLGDYNGVHLVHLARQQASSATCIVHGHDDHALGLDAQRAGAFYEWRDSVVFAFPKYLAALGALPSADRRDPTVGDRRVSFRGGRRITDVAMLHALRRLPPSPAAFAAPS